MYRLRGNHAQCPLCKRFNEFLLRRFAIPCQFCAFPTTTVSWLNGDESRNVIKIKVITSSRLPTGIPSHGSRPAVFIYNISHHQKICFSSGKSHKVTTNKRKIITNLVVSYPHEFATRRTVIQRSYESPLFCVSIYIFCTEMKLAPLIKLIIQTRIEMPAWYGIEMRIGIRNDIEPPPKLANWKTSTAVELCTVRWARSS